MNGNWSALRIVFLLLDCCSFYIKYSFVHSCFGFFFKFCLLIFTRCFTLSDESLNWLIIWKWCIYSPCILDNQYSNQYYSYFLFSKTWIIVYSRGVKLTACVKYIQPTRLSAGHQNLVHGLLQNPGPLGPSGHGSWWQEGEQEVTLCLLLLLPLLWPCFPCAGVRAGAANVAWSMWWQQQQKFWFQHRACSGGCSCLHIAQLGAGVSATTVWFGAKPVLPLRAPRWSTNCHILPHAGSNQHGALWS